MTACPTCGAEYSDDDLLVDLETNTAVVDGVAISLFPKEAELLYILHSFVPGTAPRERIIMQLWGGSEPDTAESALNVHISNLRRALAQTSLSIPVVQGQRRPGYRLVRHD